MLNCGRGYEVVKGTIRWKRWGIGLISLVVLVWMTWFFGYTYVRMVTQSKSPVQPVPSTVEQSEIHLNLTGFEFWTNQIGVFQSEENAREEKGRLEQLGWETQIIGKNPWVLGIGYAHSSEELSVIREQLKEGGIVSVPKKIQLPDRAYLIRGDGAETTAKVLEAVHAFLKVPLASRGEVVPQLEKKLVIPIPIGLSELQEAGLVVVKGERTLHEDARRIITLRLLIEYQETLEELKK
jgi:hypothetical protein